MDALYPLYELPGQLYIDPVLINMAIQVHAPYSAIIKKGGQQLFTQILPICG